MNWLTASVFVNRRKYVCGETKRKQVAKAAKWNTLNSVWRIYNSVQNAQETKDQITTSSVIWKVLFGNLRRLPNNESKKDFGEEERKKNRKQRGINFFLLSFKKGDSILRQPSVQKLLTLSLSLGSVTVIVLLLLLPMLLLLFIFLPIRVFFASHCTPFAYDFCMVL